MTTQHRSRTKAAKIEDLVVGQKTKVAEFNITSGSLGFHDDVDVDIGDQPLGAQLVVCPVEEDTLGSGRLRS